MLQKRTINSYGFGSRWKAVKQNILQNRLQEKWAFIISVELLEHLENPATLLKTLRAILQEGGYGFITAANEDHIYLYNNAEEVKIQIKEAGFEIFQSFEEAAYFPKKNEIVPSVATFIVR
tara:strand:+ start:2314 stop:2676 length:363 start_codon:yes stop_codon:yes gene_type:complete